MDDLARTARLRCQLIANADFAMLTNYLKVAAISNDSSKERTKFAFVKEFVTFGGQDIHCSAALNPKLFLNSDLFSV
eukprot:m.282412 g.282412  ORF g.282412 m.282412 type:complete len:77 (+) comp17748_c0_seq2:6537-6767(+)